MDHKTPEEASAEPLSDRADMSQMPNRQIIQKHEHYRSPKLLALANGAPCMNCGAEDGTVVAAHSNCGGDGKGMGIKADDFAVAFLCYDCHDRYDRGVMRQDGFTRAVAITYCWLMKNGKLKVAGRDGRL